MTDHIIEPRALIDLVERYVSQELRDTERYENRTPLDEGGVWELHRLAAEIYAIGVADGTQQERLRASGVRQRAADKARTATVEEANR